MRKATVLLSGALVMAVLLLVSETVSGTAGAETSVTSTGVSFGKTFWKQWGDGNAELASYDLTLSRYGQARQGMAVSIVIPETFSNTLRVKADRGKHPESDQFPVLKLNLIEDFPTGIYDYNLMTSVFTTMAGVNGRATGSPTKISFSAQEWCGHVWGQLRFDTNSVRSVGHSYFDGEADSEGSLEFPPEGISEDALLLWARGWVAPRLRPGEKRDVPLLPALKFARMAHEALAWTEATLSHSVKSRKVTVPAGTFETDVLTAAIKGGRTWTFFVEQGGERRVVKWQTSDGQKAELVSSARLAYWQMNDNRYLPAVQKLGLSPRPARTP